MPPAASRQTYRFGEFELDVAAYELRRAGRPVKLERRPMELLILLVERRSDLVSRADIVKKLWGDDVFVDVDMGVNTAIRKVRQALGDSPDVSVFVTTVSGKGYRFTANVSDAERHGAVDVGAGGKTRRHAGIFRKTGVPRRQRPPRRRGQPQTTELSEPGNAIDVESETGTMRGRTATIPFVDPRKERPVQALQGATG